MNLKTLFLVKGTAWRIRKLTYGDDVRLKEIWDLNFEPIPVDKRSAEKLIGQVFSNNMLPDAFAVMLRPVWPLGWWNRLVLRRLGVRADSPLAVMQNDDVAEAALLFFSVNVSWIGTYFSFVSDTLYSTKTISLLGGTVQLKNPLYRSPTETPSKPTES